MIIIYYWDKKKIKKRLHFLDAVRVRIKKKHSIDISSKNDVFFTGCVPNDRGSIRLNNKSLSY